MLQVGKWLTFIGVVGTAVWVGYDIGAGVNPIVSASTLFVVLGGFIGTVFATAAPNPGNPNDIALYKEFVSLLPPNDMGVFLRYHDFGNDFDRRYATPLYNFADYWNGPEKRFVDPDLEMSRRRLFENGRRLGMTIALCTVLTDRGDFITAWPGRGREIERPPHVWKDIDEMNVAAREFSDTYDRFIEFARTKLHVESGT